MAKADIAYHVVRCFDGGGRILSAVKTTCGAAKLAAADTLYNCDWTEIERVETRTRTVARVPALTERKK